MAKKVVAKKSTVVIAAKPKALVKTPVVSVTKKVKAKPASVLVLSPAPPESAVPSVPDGFVAPTKAQSARFKKPSDAQRPLALDLSTELQNATNYVVDFGSRAPDPQALAEALVLAAGWDAAYDASMAFATYALAMRGTAWDAALQPMQKLSKEFTSAVDDEPKIAKTYRHLASFVGVRAAQAKRGAKTRKSNKKKGATK